MPPDLPAPAVPCADIIMAPTYTPGNPRAFRTGKSRRLTLAGILSGDVSFEMGIFPTGDMDLTEVLGVAFAAVGTEETTPGSNLYLPPKMGVLMRAYCRRVSTIDAGVRWYGMRYGFVVIGSTEYNWPTNSGLGVAWPEVYTPTSDPGSGWCGFALTQFSGWYRETTYPVFPVTITLRMAREIPYAIGFDVEEVFDPYYDAGVLTEGHFYEVLKVGGNWGITVSGGGLGLYWSPTNRPALGSMLATNAFDDVRIGDATTFEKAQTGALPGGPRTIDVDFTALRDAGIVESVGPGRVVLRYAVYGHWDEIGSSVTTFWATGALEHSQDGSTWTVHSTDDLLVQTLPGGVSFIRWENLILRPVQARYWRWVMHAHAEGIFAPLATGVSVALYLSDFRILPGLADMFIPAGEEAP